ncbi:MAG: SIMPL domain-containing protein [Acidimicrobiales bacterium]|jgi:hypothetical protein|nr:SIMPL domain-containing protein [Acidimicrobiales bacterium]
MRRTTTLAVLVPTLLLVAACGQDPPQVTVNEAIPSDHGPDALPNGVTVSGEGEIEVAPDTLVVSFGVSIKRPTVDAAVADVAAVSTAMLDAAKANGVQDADVQTHRYSISPEFIYPENGRPTPDGFRVANTWEVRIRDLAIAGATIDAVTAAGGDDVVLQGVSFSLEDDTAALQAARDAAFADARAKAEQYATLSGQPLGAAEAISDVVVTPETLDYEGAEAGFAADELAAPATTPFSPGEVSTTVTVSVRFRLG